MAVKTISEEKLDEYHEERIGHPPVWERCEHEGVGSKGSHPACTRICQYGALSHEVDQTTGTDHYPDNWAKLISTDYV